MKVVFYEDFYHVYTSDPAAEKGRMEAVVDVIERCVEFVASRKSNISILRTLFRTVEEAKG